MDNRLIHAIDMVIICTFTMMSGSKARAANLFSTGKYFLKLLSGKIDTWKFDIRLTEFETTNIVAFRKSFLQWDN